MKPYTVILIRPDYIAENYGEDFYFAHVEAENPTAAVKAAQIEVVREDGYDEDHAENYALVAIFEGHHEDVRDEGSSG